MVVISILSVLINFVNSYVVARFARKMFATTLAGSFLFSCLAIGLIIDSSFNTEITSSAIFLGIIFVIALLILILANPLRYLIAYGFTFLLLITLLLPFDLVELISENKVIALVLIILPIVPVIILRKQIKLFTIGLSSGGSMGFGLISFIHLITKPTEGVLLLDSMLYLISIGFGIYFQFKMYDTVFGKSENKEVETNA